MPDQMPEGERRWIEFQEMTEEQKLEWLFDEVEWLRKKVIKKPRFINDKETNV